VPSGSVIPYVVERIVGCGFSKLPLLSLTSHPRQSFTTMVSTGSMFIVKKGSGSELSSPWPAGHGNGKAKVVESNPEEVISIVRVRNCMTSGVDDPRPMVYDDKAISVVTGGDDEWCRRSASNGI